MALNNYDSMLIDTRNALYRAIYAGLAENKGDYGISIFFRFIASYVRKFKPKTVHLFWDEKREKVWRKKISSEYKGNRDKGNQDKEKVDKLLREASIVIEKLVKVCACRTYFNPKQEADDLIYAYCRQNIGDKIIIVSSDGDFRQLVFSFRNVDLYNPLGKSSRLYEIEKTNPIELKCFTGEKGDNISGYRGIGPVKGKMLVIDSEARNTFFKNYGTGIYIRNKILIDLSLCPYVLRNMKCIMKGTMTPVVYDISEAIKIIQKYKVKGMMGEISSSLTVFRGLH